MWLGPVFYFELVRTARRWRFYAIRFAFGAVLLLLLAVNYLNVFDPSRPYDLLGAPPVSLRQLAGFARSLFHSMLWAQGCLVVGLTPGLVADAIAGERQRKTLHYLMASRLTSAEVVLGKLAARLLHLAVFVAVTLPVVSLLTLFGGIDPAQLAWGFAATGSTTYWLASAAILASATTRRPREAFLASYLAAGALIAGPAVADGLIQQIPPGTRTPALDALHDVNAYLAAASPLGLLSGAGPGSAWGPVATMIGLQLAGGTAFVALAAWRLRPAYRRIEGADGARRAARRRWRLRLLPLPDLGDDPVYWREAHVAGSGAGPVRLVARVALTVLVLVIAGAVLSEAPGAFDELRRQGPFSADGPGYGQRSQFNVALRFGGAALLALWMLAVAAATAAGIASEREGDTWTGLLATPLDGAAILRGKMLGPLRALAPLAAPIPLLWAVGLAAGAIHPLGMILGLAGLALFTWYAVALGTSLSLLSRTAWRAQSAALMVLIAPHFCCLIPSPLYLTGFALVSYADIAGVGSFVLPAARSGWEYLSLLMVVGYFVGGPLLHALAAWVMTRGAFDGFDRRADRPMRRPGPAPGVVFLDTPAAKPAGLDL